MTPATRPQPLELRDDRDVSHHPGGCSAWPLPRGRRLVVLRRLLASGSGLLRYAARQVPRQVLLDAWPGDLQLLERLLGRARQPS
jgi:hypothetical protein